MSVDGDTVTETRVLTSPNGAALTAVLKYPVAKLGDPKTEIIDSLVVRLPGVSSASRVHPSLRPDWMDLSLSGPGAQNYELTPAQPERPERADLQGDDLVRAAKPRPGLVPQPGR